MYLEVRSYWSVPPAPTSAAGRGDHRFLTNFSLFAKKIQGDKNPTFTNLITVVVTVGHISSHLIGGPF
jgi:hypothetical protein